MGGHSRPLELNGLAIPSHIAIVMDGSGRWASEHGLARQAGYAAGVENLREVVGACVEFGIEVLTIYAVSSANGDGVESDVPELMRYFFDKLDQELPALNAQGVSLRHFGDHSEVEPELRQKLLYAVERTKDNDRLILNVASNYGGRSEIIRAVRQILAEGISADELSEELFGSYLFTNGLQDPDLVIRTNVDLFVSDFLIWQAAYAEIYPADKYWPDFGREELYEALVAYSERDRRFGLVKDT